MISVFRERHSPCASWKTLARRVLPSSRTTPAAPTPRTVAGGHVHFHLDLPEVTENLQQKRGPDSEGGPGALRADSGGLRRGS